MRAIYPYMATRAKAEKTEHTLTPEWYDVNFQRGVRSFFNVDVDENGNPIRDRENPKFFRRYKRMMADKTDKTPGYCAMCRAKEIQLYGNILNSAGPRHTEAVKKAGCGHPADHSFEETCDLLATMPRHS